MNVWFFIVAMLICGGISAAIGTSKNHNGLQSFLAGALLGIVGVVIVAVAPRRQPAAPTGFQSVKCPRCNAQQNVPIGESTFNCWQCHLTNAVGQRKPESEDMREWLDRVEGDDQI